MVADLRLAAESGTDTGVTGTGGEAAFRKWIGTQLPRRYIATGGSIVSAHTPPTNQRDCLLFDTIDCAAFRTMGDHPDLFPIEGIVGAIELNTGRSGATRDKVLHDAQKLAEIGMLAKRHAIPPLPTLERLEPIHVGQPTLSNPMFVARRMCPPLPFLFIFAQSIRGSLDEYARAIVTHNLKTTIGESVDGLFVLDQGYALHLDRSGWSTMRLPQIPLAIVHGEAWEVLLKLIITVWSHLWKATHLIADLGQYYASFGWFEDNERPRAEIVSGEDYAQQSEEGFLTVRPGDILPGDTSQATNNRLQPSGGSDRT